MTAPLPRSELVARLLTAAAGIPVLLLVIWVGGPAFTAVVAVLLAVAVGELSTAARVSWRDPLALVGMAGAAVLAVLAGWRLDALAPALAVTTVLALLLCIARAETEHGFVRWSAVVAAVVYAGLLGAHLVPLRHAEDGRSWTLLMLFTVFATDTGAYFTGRLIGGPKLAPRISPGKTIAGAVGGIVWGGLVAFGLNDLLRLGMPAIGAAGLGAVAAVAAVTGDLAESLIKRSLGVKDMGRLFPGHGGALDRMDSVLFAAPLIYWAMRWITR